MRFSYVLVYAAVSDDLIGFAVRSYVYALTCQAHLQVK